MTGRPLSKILYAEDEPDIREIAAMALGSAFGAKRKLGRLARFVAVTLVAASVPALALAEPLTIGTISDEPVNEIGLFSPIARYLAKRLEPRGITHGRVAIATSIGEMANLIKDRRVDIYVDSPLTSIAVNHLTGGAMLLRRWKNGKAEYHAVVFTRRDSGIETLENLQGGILAFEELFSSSGHILPRIAIMKEGLTLVQADQPGANVAPGRIGFVFSSDDENTMTWVLRNRVDAGAMSFKNFRKHAKASLVDLRIIKRTFSIPRHVVNVRKGLPADLVVALKQTLAAIDGSEEGRKLLAAFDKTTRFDVIPDEARAMLEQIRPFVIEVLKLR